MSTIQMHKTDFKLEKTNMTYYHVPVLTYFQVI